MTAPLLALSLSNTLLKVGALAAFAGLVGIAILSLLVFSQARELKRLREWAGRAPERAAELEQRVSAEAAARLQRTVPPQRVGGVTVPRATPMVTRVAPMAGPATAVAAGGAPVSAAGGTPLPATGQGGLPAGQQPPTSPGQPAVVPMPGQPAPAQPGVGPPSGQPASPAQPEVTPLPGQPAFVPTAQSTPATGGQQAVAAVRQDADRPVSDGERPTAGDAAQSTTGAEPISKPATGGEPQEAVPVPLAQPVTDAARSPVEQAPALAPVAAATIGASAGRVAKGATALGEDAESSPAPGVPTPATVAARTAPAAGRAPAPPTGGRPATLPPRPARPAAPPPAGSAQTARISGRPAVDGSATRSAAARVPGPPFLQEERSSGRTTALIVGGVVVGVAVLVGVLLSLGGGSHQNTATGSTSSRSASSASHGRGSHHARVVASPAETHVVVLNSTETTGLAHRLSANLRQGGYTRSAALDGHPALRATSVVEYAGGHRTEALHVGQTLGISQVQPLESAVAPLAGSATVVVIAGTDQAAALGGGEAESGSGTPSASTEAPAGGEAPSGGEAAGGVAQ
jgi:hypothetical protein